MLLDKLNRPVRDLRISVTDRCNFRCPYCMPAEIYGDKYEFLPKADLLTFEETTRLVRIFVRLGVTKIRLTGGEPLVRQDVEKLVAMLAQVEGIEDLTLTTNGFLLAEKARALKEAGLMRVTVSLDSLDDEVFKRMNGRGHGTKRVLAGIRAAEEVGLRPIKINAVVQRGVNDHTIVDLARHFRGTGHILRFIEFMDVGTINGWKMEQVVPAAEIVRRINEVFPIEPVERSHRSEVASRYRYADGQGEIGIISSVTEPFCGDCVRSRLSPNGRIFTCLFAANGHDIRGPMRAGESDAELEARLHRVWGLRADRYSEERYQMLKAGVGVEQRKKIEMFQIGG